MSRNCKKVKNKSFVVLLVVIYATMLLFGLLENIKGVSFSLIKDEFNIAYSAQGGLVSFSWFGYVIFCIVATISIEKYGSKKSLAFGYIFIIIGCLMVSIAPSYLMITASLMILWMGFGFFEVGGNAIATTVFNSNSAILMNLMHFFYGLGAVLGPKFAGTIVDKFDTSFRGIYLFAIIPTILVLGLVLFSKVDTDSENEDEKGTMTIKSALKNKYVWIFALCLGFMEVIEFSAANWGGFYLRDAFGLNPLTIGATFISIYYVFFTISRLFSGFAIEKIGYVKSITISLSVIIVLYLIGFSAGKNGIIFLAATGFFVAIMWPTLMCVAMDIFKKDTAIATSVIIVISGSINGAMQLTTGFINEYIGNIWGYRFSLIYTIIPLILILIIGKQIKEVNNQNKN